MIIGIDESIGRRITNPPYFPYLGYAVWWDGNYQQGFDDKKKAIEYAERLVATEWRNAMYRGEEPDIKGIVIKTEPGMVLVKLEPRPYR